MNKHSNKKSIQESQQGRAAGNYALNSSPVFQSPLRTPRSTTAHKQMTGCCDATKFHKLSKTAQSSATPSTSRKYHGGQELLMIQLMVWPRYQPSLKQIRTTKPYWKAAGSLTGHAGVKTHPGKHLTTLGIYLDGIWPATSHCWRLNSIYSLQQLLKMFCSKTPVKCAFLH